MSVARECGVFDSLDEAQFLAVWQQEGAARVPISCFSDRTQLPTAIHTSTLAHKSSRRAFLVPYRPLAMALLQQQVSAPTTLQW